jgi:hypothetical protein
MVGFWLGVAIIVAAVFGISALSDRRSRRRGHRTLDGGARWTHVRERIRDARAYDSQHGVVPGVAWMAEFRPSAAPDGRPKSD